MGFSTIGLCALHAYFSPLVLLLVYFGTILHHAVNFYLCSGKYQLLTLHGVNFHLCSGKYQLLMFGCELTALAARLSCGSRRLWTDLEGFPLYMETPLLFFCFFRFFYIKKNLAFNPLISSQNDLYFFVNFEHNLL